MSKDSFLNEVATIPRQQTPAALAQDEAFWTKWAREYERDERFVQLNYGYYHPSLRPVLEVELALARELNRRGAQFKLTESIDLLEAARTELAELAGVDRDEVVITRNATEALNIVIQGFPLKADDEVVASDQDYDSMTQAWDQRAQVVGVRIRRVQIPIDPEDDAEIVRAFEGQITERTRVLHVTHVLHSNGHVLPVAKLCALGRSRGIPVLVDAAHSFAHIDFSIRELDCEFLGTSLHKWLGAPLGTGMLFVRKNRIRTLKPLYGDSRRAADDIRRLEHFGNRPDSLLAGLREAIRWHRALTTPVKHARLHSLQRSWSDAVRAMSRFRLFTPHQPQRHGAIGAFALEGVPAEKLCAHLMEKHQLFTAVQKVGSNSVVRVTPGLPTSRTEIGRLVDALAAAAAVL